ncbi:hypothetical protein A2U01_0107363, partial [Trifolium medium]|nr:hypothetical protein [Trifolium medium]
LAAPDAASSENCLQKWTELRRTQVNGKNPTFP